MDALEFFAGDLRLAETWDEVADVWNDFGRYLLTVEPPAPEPSAGIREVVKTWSPVKEVETLDELLDSDDGEEEWLERRYRQRC